MAEYEKKVRKILDEHNCVFVRHGKGDHDIWFSPLSNRHFTVDTRIKSRHTANAIMKQSGINHKFWLELKTHMTTLVLPYGFCCIFWIKPHICTITTLYICRVLYISNHFTYFAKNFLTFFVKNYKIQLVCYAHFCIWAASKHAQYGCYNKECNIVYSIFTFLLQQ